VRRAADVRSTVPSPAIQGEREAENQGERVVGEIKSCKDSTLWRPVRFGRACPVQEVHAPPPDVVEAQVPDVHVPPHNPADTDRKSMVFDDDAPPGSPEYEHPHSPLLTRLPTSSESTDSESED
jgi:hypothetical protein